MSTAVSQSVDSFLDLVEKSEVIAEEKFEQARELTANTSDVKQAARVLVKNEVLTTWQAYQLMAGVWQLRVGKYTLREQLGKSELGRVYLASHTQLGREVALKILANKHLGNQEGVNRFLDEARLAAQLDHRNVIHVYDVDKHGDRYFVVMEPIQGRDLQSVVEESGPLPFHDIANYIRQSARGLVHAHEKELIHRDLKPANISVDDQGLVKITDFGIGRVAEATLSDDTEDVGTITHSDFISPEQVIGKGEISPLTDVYSLGCVMYYLLTGQPPFGSGSEAERRKKHVTQKPQPIAELRDDAPAGLVNICRKMMAKKTENRFRSAEAVEAILTKWIDQFQPAEETQAIVETEVIAPIILSEEKPSATTPDVDVSPGIGINTKARRGKSKKKPAQPATKSDSDAPTPGEKKKLPLAWIIGGVVAALMLVMAGVVGVGLFVVFGLFNAADQVTDAVDAELQTAMAEVEGDLANSGEDSADNSETTEPDSSPDASATSDAEATIPDADVPVEVVEDVTPHGDEAEPVANSPPDTATPPTTPDPVSPAPAEPAKETEIAKTDPPKATPPTTKPAPQKLPPPFSKLPKELALPAVTSSEPFEIGEVFIPEDDPLFVRTRGGDRAFKEPYDFVIRNKDIDSDRDWTVFLKNTEDTSRGDPIANLALRNNKLTFQWTPDATSIEGAGTLSNCMLSLAADDESQVIGLRKAQLLEPIEIDAAETKLMQKWDIDNIPDVKNVEIEILGVSGFPRNTIDPEGPFGITRGDALVLVTGTPLQFDVEVKYKRQLQMDVAVQIKIPGDKRVSRFVPKKLKEMSEAAGQRITFLQNAIADAEKQNKQLGKDQKNRNKVTANLRNINLANKEITQLQTGVAMVEKTLPLAEKKGHVHFRVFYRVGTAEVEIARTKGAEKLKASAAEKK